MVRARGARGQGVELDPDEGGWTIRTGVPLLRPGAPNIREDLGVAGSRANELIQS